MGGCIRLALLATLWLGPCSIGLAQSPSAVPPAPPVAASVIQNQLPAPTQAIQRGWIEDHQVLMSGMLTFAIGLISATVVFSNHLRDRAREKREKSEKKVAFYILLEIELEGFTEDLKTSMELLKSYRPDDFNRSQTINLIRRASQITSPNILAADWERFSIIGHDTLRRIRRMIREFDEAKGIFSLILESSELARLPLFKNDDSGADVDELSERVDILCEHLDATTRSAMRVAQTISAQLKLEEDSCRGA
jgi:hypothetical protein